jgi:magnesium chelatase family protein
MDAYEVEIQVNGAHGSPKMIIVGLPDTAVKESQHRVTTAIINSGYHWPRGTDHDQSRPGDIKKEEPSFDLPIALELIAVAEELDGAAFEFEKYSFVGEVALDGGVRSVKGVLPVTLEARRQKNEAIFVPAVNANEAAMVEGTTVAFTIFARPSTFRRRTTAISPRSSPPTRITTSISRT